MKHALSQLWGMIVMVLKFILLSIALMILGFIGTAFGLGSAGITVLCLVFVGLLIWISNKRSDKKEKKKAAAQADAPVDIQPITVPRGPQRGDTEERIFVESEEELKSSTPPTYQEDMPIGLSVEERIDQLKTLKEAGLIENEEYRQQREKILKEQ